MLRGPIPSWIYDALAKSSVIFEPGAAMKQVGEGGIFLHIQKLGCLRGKSMVNSSGEREINCYFIGEFSSGFVTRHR